MINSILIPTDFSAVANNALAYALELAQKCNAKIHVLHVKQVPIADPVFPAETYQLYIDEINQAEQEGLNKIKQGVLNNTAIKWEWHSTTGFVNDEIIQHSLRLNVDLIVMGTTGASGLAEILVGSNAASVIGKSTIPVLVIPPGHRYKELKHVMYATDYNEPEFPSVSRMMFFAELYDAKVTILHIKTDYDRYFNAENNFFVKNKEALSHPDLTVINIENQEVIKGIDHHVAEGKVDLLVMAKHNRNFFDRLFHRSLSKQMAYHTQIPLLVLNKD